MTTPSWFDPKVTLGNVLTILMMMAAAMAAYGDLSSREQVTADHVAALTSRIDQMASDHDVLIKIETSLEFLKQELVKEGAR